MYNELSGLHEDRMTEIYEKSSYLARPPSREPLGR